MTVTEIWNSQPEGVYFKIETKYNGTWLSPDHQIIRSKETAITVAARLAKLTGMETRIMEVKK